MGEWLFIIVIIVISALLKGGGSRKNQRPRQGQSVQDYQAWQNRNAVNAPRQNQNVQYHQRPQPSAAQQAAGTAQAVAEQMQQAAAAMSQKQRELKARLQQKYPQAAQRAQSYQPQQGTQPYQPRQAEVGRYEQSVPQEEPGDIVSRAVRHVGENEVDMLEQENFLANVETLMITGYQAKLTYERDFLSEGMDLLNSYRIPDAVPEYMESER